MGSRFDSSHDAVAFVRSLYEDRELDNQSFVSESMTVNEPESRYLRYIEETMFTCIHEKLPHLHYQRMITVCPGRRYIINIEGRRDASKGYHLYGNN